MHVDDQNAEKVLMGKALRACGCSNPIQWFENGQEAVDFLQGTGKYVNMGKRQIPVMILLDLKMPILDGLGMLRIIKDDDRLKQIPVIIVSSSVNDDDVTEAYVAGANAFVAKPMDYTGFQELAKSFKEFWFTQNYFSPMKT
jgi:two-component system, response regulator